MPNLVGLWRPKAPANVLETILERQIAAVQSAFGPYRIHRAFAPGWSAAHLDHGLHENGDQPGISADTRWYLLLDGEVLNVAELTANYRLASRARRQVASACADLVAARGIEVVSEFNGTFVLVIWDAQERCLHLVCDRHGVRPLFYRATDSGLLFASEIKGVVAGDISHTAQDPTAICEQLIYGAHFAGRTWLEGCQRLPPANILTVDASGVKQRSYWRYKYKYSTMKLDQQAYATRFAVLLDRAVERCMRGSKRIGIFLSGGYDSRSVAASIRSHHLPIPAFTFGNSASRDFLIAPLLAKRLNLSHYPLPASGPYLARHAHEIVWRTEGLLSFANATSVQFHETLVRHIDIFLTGFLGEFSGSHTWPALLVAGNRKQAIAAIYKRFVAPKVENARAVLRNKVFERAIGEVHDRFHRSFEDIDNDHPFDVADAWNFTFLQQGGSFQAPAVDRHRLEMRAPHLDHDLVDFLMTIPPNARIEQRVYKKMIANSFPFIRDVPCANSMQPIEPRFWIEYPAMIARLVGRKIAAPVRSWIGREDVLGRELSDLDTDVREEVELQNQFLLPLSKEGHLDPSIFDIDAIVRLSSAHYAGVARHGRLLTQLISIGLAVRQILAGERSEVPSAYRTAAKFEAEAAHRD